MFDGLIYQSEAADTNSTAAGSPTTTSATTTSTTAPSHRRKAIIIGSTVGGICLLLAAFCTVGFLRRRAKGWRNLAVDQPYPVDAEKLSSPVTVVDASEPAAPVRPHPAA
ncbi:hypothetical protein C8F04DRAFT_1271447 [Mycena alexandri]|uniref:Uncharacterized protein n=1 Tax=Mycena alexandri TaxID=1745969 RepID=A0AAD6S8Z3_9AGAR|nr:hypothetical protein C8F04DRAFT_1271447 [Mycena alexandri]